ncbi:MAG TPA: hypothetical protein VFV33_05705, partial [Gemmatimonadaceae bacterium]|nr:hypothetical protein [Gemmatimonadaceae bacterium]
MSSDVSPGAPVPPSSGVRPGPAPDHRGRRTGRAAAWGRTLLLGVAALAAVVVLAKVVTVMRDLIRGSDGGALAIGPGDLPPIPDLPSTASVALPDSFAGRSGALHFRALTPAEALAVPGFVQRYGERALKQPAVHLVARDNDSIPFALIVQRPFGSKRGEVLNGYRLGRWPAERWIMARNYFNPDGFVEVTPQNVGLRLSDHFTLGDFLTHDQRDRWPKYVVLEEKLIDKLELVLADLAAHGIPTGHVVVLSGFRAPYYNDRGVGEGMARASRHQFGDAADLIIDDDGNGRMDDLNRDGVVDLRDTAPITAAIARVEKAHPDLVGGLGTYQAMGPSGPFA